MRFDSRVTWLGSRQHKMWVGFTIHLLIQSRCYAGWTSVYDHMMWCFPPWKTYQPTRLFNWRGGSSWIICNKLWCCHSLRDTVLVDKHKRQKEDLHILCIFTSISFHTYICKEHIVNYVHENKQTEHNHHVMVDDRLWALTQCRRWTPQMVFWATVWGVSK